MINIICIGSLKEKYSQEAEVDYLKRLTKYTKINLIELKEEPTLKKEEEKILEKIKDNDYVITLDIEGKEYSSKELSNKIDNLLVSINKDITFIIGSSHGLSQNIKNKSNLSISFSKLTFPHQLFRIMFLEQLYRSFKIINNEPYHK